MTDSGTQQRITRVLDILRGKITNLAHADNYALLSVLNPEGVVLHHMAGTLSGTDTWFAMGRAQRQEANDRLWRQQKMAGSPPRAFVSSAHAGVGGIMTLDGLTRISTYVPANRIAYHAGGALRPGVTRNPNTHMLGIEHESTPANAVAQEITSAIIIAVWSIRYVFAINEKTIVPHSALSNTASPGQLDVASITRRAAALAVTIRNDATLYERAMTM